MAAAEDDRDKARAIDGPTSGTIPPYNSHVVLAPERPGRVASELRTALGGDVDVLIVDINDLGGNVLGSTMDRAGTRAMEKLLRDNPLGDPHERPVYVYLPPGYDDSDRRYPVVYVLQGYTGHVGMWFNRPVFNRPYPELADDVFARRAGLLKAHGALAEITRDIETLATRRADAERRADYLRHVVREIDDARLREGEEVTLEAREVTVSALSPRP